MRKKILFSFIIASMVFNLCSCGKSDGASDSTLTASNVNEIIKDTETIEEAKDLIPSSDSTLTVSNENEIDKEAETIEEAKDLIPSSWEFFEENNTVPIPDSCIKDTFFMGISDGNFYTYYLSDDYYDAVMSFRAYVAVLLGCGCTIEKEDVLYMIYDNSGKIVGSMGFVTEDDSYLLVISFW